MTNENNNFLHGCAFAVLVIVLVYAGEQWRGLIQNGYIKYTLWAAGCGIVSFVLSFMFGFINFYYRNIANNVNLDKWLIYQGHPVSRLELSVEDARKMQNDSSYYGWLACLAKEAHIGNLIFTSIGAVATAAAPILFLIGVILGK